MVKPIEACHKAVGARLQLIREALGLTQSDVAAKMTLDRTSVTNIEAGRQRLSLSTVEEFARALGTTPKHIFKGIWW